MALNVLVVDDSTVMRSMIIKVLRLSGLPLNEIYQAANGAEALEVISDNWIDLALVDINMPVMNGEELIDRLRENPETADLPVVVVSSEGSETRIEILRKKGAEFVHKPFNAETIRETVVAMTGVSEEQNNEEQDLQSSNLSF